MTVRAEAGNTGTTAPLRASGRCASLAAMPHATRPHAAGRLRVVTLNLLHGAPIPPWSAARTSLEARLAWTAGRLAEERPDVVLLQEASITPRHGDTAATLAERLGMAHVYARANPAPLWTVVGLGGHLVARLSFEEGPAILSRLPIVAHRVHRLSSRATLHERRIALEAVLDGPMGRFSVFCVHLTARSPAGRRHQIAALAHAVEASPHPHPVIVGGDFNAEEHSHEIRWLTHIAGWIDSFRHVHPDAPGHTWGQVLAAATATAGRRIDFLFSAPAAGEHWDPRHSRLILDRAFPESRDGVLWASDHYGVLTEFEAPSSAGTTSQTRLASARSMGDR
jgi:endonuclease/exonuclease/phosphatase family metal-dependent hydrolase